MDGVKAIQIKGEGALVALRKAVKDGDEFVLFDGDEPLYKCVPVANVLEQAAKYLTHFPHEPAACLSTCWRHDPKIQAEAQARAEAEAAAEAEDAEADAEVDPELAAQHA